MKALRGDLALSLGALGQRALSRKRSSEIRRRRRAGSIEGIGKGLDSRYVDVFVEVGGLKSRKDWARRLPDPRKGTSSLRSSKGGEKVKPG